MKSRHQIFRRLKETRKMTVQDGLLNSWKFIVLLVLDALQPSEKFDGWPGRRPSWLKEIQMTLFGWR